MKTKNVLCIIMGILLFPCIIHAQTFTLKGKVTDKETLEILPGASVRIEGTFLGTSCSNTGEFAFKNLKEENYVLLISFVGYETTRKEIELRKDESIEIQLLQSPITKDEIIVKGIRANDNTPATWQNITAEKMKENGIMQDIPQLLEMTPSVVSTSDAGTGIGYTGMRIRGTDINRINVTIDGVPFNDPESHDVYWVDLPDLVSSVDNIQIQRGVGTSSNGSSAFGASINVQTARISAIPFAELNSSYGSFNSSQNNIRFGSGILNNTWAFDGKVSTSYSDGFIDRAYAKLNSVHLNGSYYSKKTVLRFLVLSGNEKTYQAWMGVPKDSLQTNRTFNPYTYSNETDNYSQQHYHLNIIHQLNSKCYVSSTLFLIKGFGYYEQFKEYKKYTSYGLTNIITGNDTIKRTDLIQQKYLDNTFYGLNAQFTYESGNKLRLYSGLTASSYQNDHSGKIIWMQYAGNIPKDYQWYLNTGNKNDISFFVKSDYKLSDRLSVYGDILLRNIDYKIKGNHDDLRDISQKHSFSFFNPKAGLTFTFRENATLYTSFGIANREPSRNEFRDANPNEKPTDETLYNLELGYIQKMKNFMYQVNFYEMNYQNQLVMTGKINNVGDAIMTNVPNSYRRGIEILASVHIFKKFQIQGNLTLSRNKILDFTEYVDDWDSGEQISRHLGQTDISFSPEIISGSEIQYTPFNKASISLYTKYVGKQYIDNTSSADRVLDAYIVNNLRLSYDLPLKTFKLVRLSFMVRNIFNELYETNAWVYRYYSGGIELNENGYFPQAGRHYMGSITIQF